MKPKEAKRLVLIGAISLVAVFVWVALDGYHQLVDQGRFGSLNQLIEPLNPQLETEVLEKIGARKEYSLEEAEKFLTEPTGATSTALLEVTSSVQSGEGELRPAGIASEAGQQQ